MDLRKLTEKAMILLIFTDFNHRDQLILGKFVNKAPDYQVLYSGAFLFTTRLKLDIISHAQSTARQNLNICDDSKVLYQLGC